MNEDSTYIEVLVHTGDSAWLGRSAILRPAKHAYPGTGVVVLGEWSNGQLHPDLFDRDLARLVELTGYEVEHREDDSARRGREILAEREARAQG